jgi:hypothetical protein
MKMPRCRHQPLRVVVRLPVAVVAGDLVHLGRHGEVLLDECVPGCGFSVISHNEARSGAVSSPDLNGRTSDGHEGENDQRITPRRRHEHLREDGDERSRCQHDEVELAVADARVAVARTDQRSPSYLGRLGLRP